MPTDQPQLIVCEKGNRWAVALRWVLTEQGVRVFETRTWPAALDAVRAGQSGLVAVELRAGNLADVVRGIVRVREQFSDVSVLVLADRAMAECEWIMREAGAVHFVASPRNLMPVARLVGRILAGNALGPDLGLGGVRL